MEGPAFKLALLLVGRTDELIIAYGATAIQRVAWMDMLTY